jgi:hypothetical protein
MFTRCINKLERQESEQEPATMLLKRPNNSTSHYTLHWPVYEVTEHVRSLRSVNVWMPRVSFKWI